MMWFRKYLHVVTLALCFDIDPTSVIRIHDIQNTTRTLETHPKPNQMAKRSGMGQSNGKLA